MGITASKIRLGAPSIMLVGTQDMGVTKGGVMLKYNPTMMDIECDQYLSPVAVFRTKEECTIEASFLQTQAAIVAVAMAVQGLGNVVTTAGTPNTDKLSFGGQVVVPTTTLDITIPKNDGTTNNLLVHLNKVHSHKETTLPFARDKDTEYKSTFYCLADSTQAVGAHLGYFTEQY